MAAALRHHFLDQAILLLGHGVGAEVGAGGVHDLERQVDRHLVVEGERSHRHAGHGAGVLDHRGRHALDQHAVAFADIGLDDARGVETARIVDDDRRLADRADEIQRAGQRLVTGLLADDDLDQAHALHRREEVNADEVLRSRRRLGERGDRQRRGVGAEDGVPGQNRLGPPDHVFLDRAVLEHRLDHEVGAGECGEVGAGVDARERRLGIGGAHAAARNLLGVRRFDGRPALGGGLLVAVDEGDGDAGAGADVGDAGTHEAGTDDRNAVGRTGRNRHRPADELVQLLHGDEQRADHRRRFPALQDLREVALLDAQRGIERHLQALDESLQGAAHGRIVVAGLLAVKRACRREEIETGRRIDLAAREAEAVHVPRLHLRRAVLQPGPRSRHQLAGGHHLVDQPKRLGARRRKLVALEQHLKRVLGVDEPRDAL